MGTSSVAADAIDAQKGVLRPMQMQDGTKRWRFVRQPTQSDTPAILTELIAQTLAVAHWCENGWEETSRHTGAGMQIIEGKCK